MALLDDKKVIFLGGLHRSGTTVLAKVLAEHPRISGFHDTGARRDEGQHLQTVFSPANVHGGSGRFAFDPAAHLTEGHATGGDAERLASQWAPYWDLGRDYLLEKSPPNLIRMRYFQALFPSARFIVVVRHPLVVSLATMKWERRGLAFLLRHWLAAHERCARDAGHVRSLLVVAYERLTTEPESALAAIHGWLGLRDADPRAHTRLQGSNDRYFARWRDMRSSAARGLYARFIERRFDPAVARYGYRMGDPTADPGPLRELFPRAEVR